MSDLENNRMRDRHEKRVQQWQEPLAIVGMAARFPGASNLEEYWNILVEGTDCIRDLPEERSQLTPHFAEIVASKREQIGRGGFLEGVDLFDAKFFGIAPREAIHADPQQRILLELAWDAFEDAGQPLRTLRNSNTSVYIGISNDEYFTDARRTLENIDVYSTTGNSRSIAANRISYWFDLKGPSVAIDTACSSSLVAIYMACKSLLDEEADLALAGGVNLILSPQPSLSFAKAGLLSSVGRCRAFDAGADGFVRSEGAGLVVLKRASLAVKNNDRIYALIHGGAINHNGRTTGLMSPNQQAQERLLRDAYHAAGVSTSQLGYVETFGVGSQLADAIEARVIGRVFGQDARHRRCWIGSVKTNIGHCEAASGVAGLIKATLAVSRRLIPKNLHFERPNPLISLEDLSLAVPREAQEWHPGEKAFAAVSAFSFGGANAHLVLGETGSTKRENGRNLPFFLPISAPNESALHARLEQFRSLARESLTEKDIAAVCFTATCRRSHFRFRTGFTFNTISELCEQLDRASKEPSLNCWYGRAASVRNPDEFGARYCAGEEVSPELISSDDRCLTLPSYPWQRERFWLTPGNSNGTQKEPQPQTPLEIEWLNSESPTIRRKFTGDTSTIEASTIDKDGRTLCTFEGLAGYTTPDNAALLSKDTFRPWLYELSWVRQQRRDNSLVLKLGEQFEQEWLIFADSNDIGSLLQEGLAEMGERATLVHHGCDDRSPNSLRLDPESADQWRDFIRSRLLLNQKQVRGLIYLWSLDEGSFEQLADLTAEEQCSGAVPILELVRAMALGGSIIPPLWIVTAGAVPAARETTSIGTSPIWGVGKVISLEHPEFRCVRIDVDPETLSLNPQAVVEELIQEIIYRKDEDQIAFKNGERYVERISECHRAQEIRESAAPISPMATYLVAGAFGTLGIHLISALCEAGARNVICIDRDIPSDGVRAEIDRLREKAEIDVVRTDLLDFASLRKVICTVEQSRPPIQGVFDLAGEDNDSLILELDASRFIDATKTRIGGGWNLYRACNSPSLEFIVFFSSAVSAVGSPGQAAVAAGCAFLDSFAHSRRTDSVRILSVNWGPWGTSTSDTQELGQGVYATLPIATGMRLLLGLIGAQVRQMIVLPFDLKTMLTSYPRASNVPLFSELAVRYDGVERTRIRHIVENGDYVSARSAEERFIASLWRQCLGVEQVSIQEDFFELGGDSIMLGQVLIRVNASYSLDISIEEAFEATTIEKQAQMVANKLSIKKTGKSD